MSNVTFWPPGLECIFQCIETADPTICNSCTQSFPQSAIDFLNLTNPDNYIQAYCLNPANDDSCPFGVCPNPDIAGPLIRVSAYVTNFCLSILVFYHPSSAETAFWSQIITTYSLIIACAITVAQGNLTRFHAAVATVVMGSPLSCYLFVYSIVSFWYRKHRLNGIVGENRLLARLTTIVAGLMWIALLLYILLPGHLSQFSQESCDANELPTYLYALPFVFLGAFAAGGGRLAWIFVSLIVPILGTIIAWIIILVRQRKKIWPENERWRPRFGRVWSITGKQYSFVHFMTIVLIPTLYWLGVVELGCLFSSDSGNIEFSYGQILALFVAIPPLLSVLALYPMLLRWLWTLTWIRRIRRMRRPGKRPTEDLPGTEMTQSAGLSGWDVEQPNLDGVWKAAGSREVLVSVDTIPVMDINYKHTAL
ncbi:hypothetical protein K474DRAFT_248409 [Panus rudis PR-1116 ss-1]|nr:hypothetical protein K474DRAFT_248409 [Panus rudis PR-1116 ss-1]